MMLWMMPLMFGFFTLSFEAGLALYWIVSNVVGIVIQGFVTGWGPLAALVSFTAANTMNYQSWLRYFEPFAHLFMALAVTHAHRARAEDQDQSGPPGWAGIGPVLLATALGAITLGRISG